MIGKLSGILDSAGEDWALVDVGGVGYVVHCSARTLRALPRPGEPVRLHIATQMREDAINLYGFVDPAEKEWFGVLQTVQGVGARVALAILSVLPPGELVQAIAAQDRAALTRAPGVGPKLGVRILSELRETAGKTAFAAAAEGGPVQGEVGSAADAISALVNLGYKRAEAFSAVSRARRDLGESAAVEALIRGGLKELAR
ncbi:MAG TPA: Holliday junction branch migration protein RuvA [Candidatus Sulfotelmatobacter sp.]|nr:Holliday junction branch migration protein RuvA [Candidatus Sulfotelmatobacter sp.]